MPDAIETERVLVLAPTSADAAITRSILDDAGIDCHLSRDLDGLARDVAAGVGAILLTDEVLAAAQPGALIEALRSQPVWSDIPVLLLLASKTSPPLAMRAMELFGNVTLLERPVRVSTLVSALRTAIRARRRQYELAVQLVKLQQAESSLRRQGERLRLLWEAASVLLITEQRDVMMQALFAKVAPHFGLDLYANYVVNEAGNGLRLESWAGFDVQDDMPYPQLDFAQGLSGKVALNRQSMTAQDIQRSTVPFLQGAREFGLRSYIGTPLLAGNKLIGTLAFASRQRDRIDAEDIEFFETLSHYVAGAYERLHLIAELRNADQRKNEFLAMLAHELRNPLAPIGNAVQTLALPSASAETLEQARQIAARQVNHMGRLVDDLLDVSRIMRGHIELRKEPVALSTVVASAIETTRAMIDGRHQSLELSVPPEPLWLNADPVRLTQAIANLLHNAAKFSTQPGRIWLSAEQDGDVVSLRVRDEGAGIEADQLPHLFELFFQGDRSLQRQSGGLGIGLTIVRQLVELHLGTIAVRSDGPGKGSEFVIRLPLMQNAPAATPSRTSRRSDVPDATRRILVVDDNEDVALSMAMVLESWGHEVQLAYDGAQALRLAEAYRPEIVLLDIGLPGMDGYEVARHLRQEQRYSKALLVAVSGYGQSKDRAQSSAAGVDHHLTKPVDHAILRSLISAAASF